MAIGEPPIVLMVLGRARPARDESRGPRAGPAQMAEATRTAVAHTFSAHSVTLGAPGPGGSQITSFVSELVSSTDHPH